MSRGYDDDDYDRARDYDDDGDPTDHNDVAAAHKHNYFDGASYNDHHPDPYNDDNADYHNGAKHHHVYLGRTNDHNDRWWIDHYGPAHYYALPVHHSTGCAPASDR